MPVVTLPDGSQRTFDRPVTVFDVAADIGAGLAKAALAGVADGREVDTSHVIERDTTLSILTDRDPLLRALRSKHPPACPRFRRYRYACLVA